MKRSIRLVATDLDGTLLRPDRTVSERTRRAIAVAQDAGIIIVIATARHPLTAREFAADAGVNGIAICLNGAMTYDVAREIALDHRSIPPETVRYVATELRRALPGVCFGLIQEMGFSCEPGYAELATDLDHGRRLADLTQGDIFDLLDNPVTKIVVRHARHSPVEVLKSLSDIGTGRFEASVSGAPFVDIVGHGVSKASALVRLCERLHIEASEVAAFGDAPNDLAMLAWAGHPYAVANAYPEVLEATPNHTSSNDEDGVAEILETLVRGS